MSGQKRIALVTGASSGLGREFARLLAKKSGVDEVWLVAGAAGGSFEGACAACEDSGT